MNTSTIINIQNPTYGKISTIKINPEIINDDVLDQSLSKTLNRITTEVALAILENSPSKLKENQSCTPSTHSYK